MPRSQVTPSGWGWAPGAGTSRGARRLLSGLLLIAPLLWPAAAAAVTTTVPVNAQTFAAVPGVAIAAGDLVTFIATGTVCVEGGCDTSATPRGSGGDPAPAGFKLPGAPPHSLVCGIGGQTPADLFYVGQHYSREAGVPGSLFCGINEEDTAGAFADNTGTWTVTVVVNGLQLTRLAGFVASFYDHVLGRTPSAPELSAWVGFLVQSGTAASAAGLVHTFLDGPEYQFRSVTPAGHVEGLYTLVLGRASEPAGAAGWVQELVRRLNTILPGFVNSPEFQSRLSGLRDRNAVLATVGRLYSLVLGRTGTDPEIAAWADYAMTTGDALGMVDGFFSSTEYISRPRTLAEHVGILYRALLDRTPAPSETQPWVDLLAQLRAPIADAFVDSPEFRARFQRMITAPQSAAGTIGVAGTDSTSVPGVSLAENGDSVSPLASGGGLVGGVFGSTYGPGATVYLNDAGQAERATFDNNTALFANYTQQTVDIALIASGQTTILNQVPLTGSPQPGPGPVGAPGLVGPDAVTGPVAVADALRAAGQSLAAASCAIAAAAGAGASPDVRASAAYICGSGIVQTFATARSAQDLVAVTVPLVAADCGTRPGNLGCPALALDLALAEVDDSAVTQAANSADIVAAQAQLALPTGNHPPAPTAPPIALLAGTTGPGFTTVAPNDLDGQQTHTFAIIVPPHRGTASVNAGGVVAYTPNQGAAGTDSVVVRVTDNGAPPLSGTVAVQVTIAGPATVVITVTDNATGNPIAGATVSQEGGGSQTTNANGVATFSNVAPGAPIEFVANATGFGAAGVTVTPVAGTTTAKTISLPILSQPRSLSVVKAGFGTGTVTSSPPGIVCGTGCSANFTSGTVITLTPAPDASSNFGGWSSEICGGFGPCTFTLTSNTTIFAIFNRNP